jgi:two-component system cell cycle sensor histidine kinase/response regulator CckA
MPRGGTLTIATAAVPEFRGNTPAGRVARLTVTDTGTGMAPEVRARVFEPFFTTKGPGKGTGLGLATVYGIVTQAGGRVEVDSTPGVGTSFRVDLPWCHDAPKSSAVFTALAANTPPPRDRLAGCGRPVLLVEDEDGVRRLGRATLEGAGYAVMDAPDGEAALDLLAAGVAAEVLVTDLTMPGIGGRELAARARETRPELGVVFISGYAPDAGWLDGIPGAVFLPKPFAPADLQKAVGKALARAARAAVTA